LPAAVSSSPDSGEGALCDGKGAGDAVGLALGSAACTTSTTTLDMTVGIRHSVVNWSADFSLAANNSRRWVLAGEPASGRAPKTSADDASPFSTSCQAAIGMAQCGSIAVVMW